MNLPNKLTVFRIFLVPLLVLVWLFPYTQFNINFISFDIAGVEISLYNIILLMIFAIASLTDMLDGQIARKRGLVTTFGKFADPIADKLLQFIVAIGLCVKFYMQPVVFIMLAIFVLKEALQAVELIYLATKKRSLDHAEWYGKLTSFVFYLILGTLLVGSPFIFEYCGEAIYNIVINVLCSIAIALLFFALVMYLIDGYKILKKKEVKDD